MTARATGVATLERLEALTASDELFELAELVPSPPPERGGRPRDYPVYMWLLFDALLSVYSSARRVEAELSHPLVWQYLRDLIAARFPHSPEKWLPSRPMRRHHYLYGRTTWLTQPDVLTSFRDLHKRAAAKTARELGLLDPGGPGSWTHPDLSRMLYADGKVITPLFRSHPGDTRLNKETGELVPMRAEPDGGLHFEGTGDTAWGTKWVIVAVRTTDIHGRVILDVDWVPSPGGEAATAMDCFRDLAPHCPGAQGVIYDTALRGVHHQTLLCDLGWLPVNKVTAAKARTKQPRRAGGRREEKSTYIEDRAITLPDGTERTVSLFAQGGAVGIGVLTDAGKRVFTELPRVRTHRNTDKNAYRWYNEYRLPDDHGGGTISIRLHGNAEDSRRRFNRTENIRPIPPHRSRLQSALPAPQRRRVDQPRPRRHPLAAPSPQHRPSTPAPQPAHPRPRRERPRSAPAPPTHQRPPAARRRLNERPPQAKSQGWQRAQSSVGDAAGPDLEQSRGPARPTIPNDDRPEPSEGFSPTFRAGPARVARVAQLARAGAL